MGVFESRNNEEYLWNIRSGRKDDYSAWHDRIDTVDELIRGNWSMVYPDQQGTNVTPIVMNLMDSMPRDIARLASETKPTYSSYATGDSKAADKAKDVRTIIGQGYFEYGGFNVIKPLLVMDLIITGTCFVGMWVDGSSDYPRFTRIDPRFCFPDIHNGSAQDLLVEQHLKARVANRLYPDADIMGRLARMGYDEDSYGSAELVVFDYYGPDAWYKGLQLTGIDGEETPDGVVIVDGGPHEIDRAPVAFAQVPSPDGALRGLLDQIGPSLVTKNRALELMMEYSHELVYSPFEAKGVINADQPPGPATIYQHDPTAQGETFMRRVSPAGSNPELIQLMNYLDAEERGQIAYPETRQGTTPQSQGSASFMTATQGQMTSLVRDMQRHLTSVQEQMAAVMFQLDERWLDHEKPLCRSLGRKKTYVPTRDIDGQTKLRVSYSASGGLDTLNNTVRVLQLYSAGLISDKKALEEIDFVDSAEDMITDRELQEQRRIILQRFEGDPTASLDFLIQVYAYQEENGGTLIDAIVEVNKVMAAQVQQQQQEQAAMAGMQPGMEPGAEALALQKGATGVEQPAAGGAAPTPVVPPSFSPAPLQQVFVK